MKLFNLNIGIKIDNADAVSGLILKENYDIVTLQESMRGLDKNVKPVYDSSNIIKSKTGFENNFFGALWVARFHKKNGEVARDFGGDVEQGNQTLTNLPIVESRNVFYYKDYSNFEDTTNFRQDDHPRAFSETILDLGGRELQIINVHGIWNKDKVGNEKTQNQTKFLLKLIRNDIPSIVVGDFNLLPNTSEIQQISQKMTNLIDKFGIKSTRPEFDDGLDKGGMVCDYIFVNDKVKANDFYVLDSDISDHLPLVLDFEI